MYVALDEFINFYTKQEDLCIELEEQEDFYGFDEDEYWCK